jgi:hypothetical protein
LKKMAVAAKCASGVPKLIADKKQRKLAQGGA